MYFHYQILYFIITSCRQAALGKWKQNLGSDATYRNLISAFECAGRKDFADAVYAIASKSLVNIQIMTSLADNR